MHIVPSSQNPTKVKEKRYKPTGQRARRRWRQTNFGRWKVTKRQKWLTGRAGCYRLPAGEGPRTQRSPAGTGTEAPDSPEGQCGRLPSQRSGITQCPRGSSDSVVWMCLCWEAGSMLLPLEPGQTFMSREWGERGATWLPAISRKGQYSRCPALSQERSPLEASLHVTRRARHLKMSPASILADGRSPTQQRQGTSCAWGQIPTHRNHEQ